MSKDFTQKKAPLTLSKQINILPDTSHNTTKMNSLGGSSEKDRIITEVKNEAAMTNARQLIEVRTLTYHLARATLTAI